MITFEANFKPINERYLHSHSFLQTSLFLLRFSFFYIIKKEKRNGNGSFKGN